MASGLGLLRDQTRAQRRVAELIQDALHAEGVVLTDSGTSALALALRASVRRYPAPVALPAWACYDLATAAIGADVPVILYDLDAGTLQPDRDSLHAALRTGARTVVIAHLYGVPVDIAGLREVWADHDPVIVDDAAQGIGATAHGRPLGAGGSLGVLSFARGKGLTAGGGGALVASDARGRDLLDVARGLLRPAGGGLGQTVRLGAQWALGRPAWYGIAAGVPALHLGETVYHAPRPIRGMGRGAAFALEVTWTRAATDASTRRANAKRLLDAVRRAPHLEAIRVGADLDPGYLRLPVLQATEPGGSAVSAGARRLGIERGYPDLLANATPLGARLTGERKDFPGARTLADRLFTFPTHGLLREDDMERLLHWIATS